MRRRALTFSTIAVLLTWASASPLADRVQLRSGQSVTGNFMSADVKIVRVMLDNGKIAEFAVDRHHRRGILPAQDAAPGCPGSCQSATADHGTLRHSAERPADSGD